MDWSSALNQAQRQLQNNVKISVDEQRKEAELLSPVDTGKLKSNWKSSGSGNNYNISNNTNYAAFQEFGTRKQPGREMLGMRSGRVKQDLITKINSKKF